MRHVTRCKSNPLIGSIKHYYVPLHDNFTQHSPWGFGTNTEAMKLAEERCKQEKKRNYILVFNSQSQQVKNHREPMRVRSQHAVGVKREKREWLAVGFNLDLIGCESGASFPDQSWSVTLQNEMNAISDNIWCSVVSPIYSRISRHTCIKLHTRLYSRQWRRTHKLSLSNMDVWSACRNGKNTALLRED